MNSSLIRLAIALVLLAACDKKKYAPTETRGSILDLRQAPTAPALSPAPAGPTRVG